MWTVIEVVCQLLCPATNYLTCSRTEISVLALKFLVKNSDLFSLCAYIVVLIYIRYYCLFPINCNSNRKILGDSFLMSFWCCIQTTVIEVFNPLCPCVTNSSSIAKISILKRKGSSKKKILWESRLWVGRRKEPILDYVPKNDEKIQAAKG